MDSERRPKNIPPFYGWHRSVVRASELKSKDSGFDPLAGKGERQFFYPSESALVQTCLCRTPLGLCMAGIQISAHVKDHNYSISFCRKREGPVVWPETKKTLHRTGRRKSCVAPHYGCSLSPRESTPKFQCIAHGHNKLYKLI